MSTYNYNNLKSTTVRGAFQNVNYEDKSILATAFFQNDVSVSGQIYTNNINCVNLNLNGYNINNYLSSLSGLINYNNYFSNSISGNLNRYIGTNNNYVISLSSLIYNNYGTINNYLNSLSSVIYSNYGNTNNYMYSLSSVIYNNYGTTNNYIISLSSIIYNNNFSNGLINNIQNLQLFSLSSSLNTYIGTNNNYVYSLSGIIFSNNNNYGNQINNNNLYLSSLSSLIYSYSGTNNNYVISLSSTINNNYNYLQYQINNISLSGNVNNSSLQNQINYQSIYISSLSGNLNSFIGSNNNYVISLSSIIYNNYLSNGLINNNQNNYIYGLSGLINYNYNYLQNQINNISLSGISNNSGLQNQINYQSIYLASLSGNLNTKQNILNSYNNYFMASLTLSGNLIIGGFSYINNSLAIYYDPKSSIQGQFDSLSAQNLLFTTLYATLRNANFTGLTTSLTLSSNIIICDNINANTSGPTINLFNNATSQNFNLCNNITGSLTIGNVLNQTNSNFYGTSTSAGTASNVSISQAATSSLLYIPMVGSLTLPANNLLLPNPNNLTYQQSTGTLNCLNFSGTATNAYNIILNNSPTINASYKYYIPFSQNILTNSATLYTNNNLYMDLYGGYFHCSAFVIGQSGFNLNNIIGSSSGDTLTINAKTTINNDMTINGINIGKGKNGDNNSCCFGASALANTITGATENIAIGYLALNATTTSAYSVAIGGYSNYQQTANNGYNVSVGHFSMLANIVGFYNVAIGSGALTFYNGNNNTAIGFNSGCKNGVLVNGANNIYLGANSGVDLTTDVNNTCCLGSSTIVDTYLYGNVHFNNNILLQSGTSYTQPSVNQLGYIYPTVNFSFGALINLTLQNQRQIINNGLTAGTYNITGQIYMTGYGSDSAIPILIALSRTANSFSDGTNTYSTSANMTTLYNSALNPYLLPITAVWLGSSNNLNTWSFNLNWYVNYVPSLGNTNLLFINSTGITPSNVTRTFNTQYQITRIA